MNKQIAGNTNTSFLKAIALVCMFCDHLGKMVLPTVPEMRMIGRIAFPLYAWCLVVGFSYTRNVGKYALRLLSVGLISQPLYMLALNHRWNEPNIFLTLLISLVGLYAMEHRRYRCQYWAPIVTLLLAVDLRCDYGWKGVLFVYLLYLCRTNKNALIGCMIPFCLFWGSNSATVTSLFGWPIAIGRLPNAVNLVVAPWLRLQAIAILALPLILWNPCKVQFKMPKWVAYSLYPIHLVLLIVIESMVKL